MLVTRTRRTWAAVALAAVTTIASAGIAAADNIQDAIEDGGGITLVAGSSTGASTTIWVIGNSNDGHEDDGYTRDPGCNWDADESPLVLDIVTPTGVTASPDPLSITACGESNAHTVTFTAAANAVSGTATVNIVSSPQGGGGYDNQVSIPITVTQPAGDTTPPVISYTLTPATPDGLNGWWKSNVSLVWTVSEPESSSSLVLDGCDPVTVNADQAATNYTCSAESDGGEASETVSIKRDATGPVVSLVSGPAHNVKYYFGSVPAAPTCTASDATSGIPGDGDVPGDPGDCTVIGYSTAVGEHTVSTSVTDRAGNNTTVSRTYEVLAWTALGFHRPVDMNGVVNSVKAGSTVPLKFELFAGPTELDDVAAIDTFVVREYTCQSGTELDALEEYTTGGTVLRYDSSGDGQFIQNWKVPAGANKCYRATMTADDGTALTALFKTR